MIHEIDIRIPAILSQNADDVKSRIADKLSIPSGNITEVKLLKRSIDARRKPIMYLLRYSVSIGESLPLNSFFDQHSLPNVSSGKKVIIVGAGPAGLFAALKFIELGVKPVILEMGKEVSDRKLDISDLNRNLRINTDSNWCFGEGGAGTFSDGKLYTRSTKRGDVSSILSILISHGANPDILIESHAHIGTDKLPTIISNIKKTIIRCGGEVHFNSKIVDILLEKNRVKALIDKESNEHVAEAYVFATGHSAIDIYELFDRKKISLEQKSFAMGFRVEHPQSLIDSAQYKLPHRPDFLPAASYSLVQQVDGRGVFSFCMCPGGVIVPASTMDQHLVLNGMSNSQRNSPYANAGIVVSVEPSDILEYSSHGPLAGLRFQKEMEHRAWLSGGGGLVAPAQRLIDFLNNKNSISLPKCSYHPGVVSSNLADIYPDFITSRLQKAFLQFDKKLKGFISSDAILVGIESRTSSPVRIPRNMDTFAHVEFDNLFPVGEGAGYAGGITSSALDGQNCAEKIAKILH